jgi:hypothetical protein
LFLSIQVGNLAAPVAEWTVGGTALTSLMDVERRHGNFLQPSLKNEEYFQLFIWRILDRYYNDLIPLSLPYLLCTFGYKAISDFALFNRT